MKFDIIIFNAPYLPGIHEEINSSSEGTGILPGDLCWYGGEQGYETTLRFLNDCPKYFKRGGHLFLTSSTQTDQTPIINKLEENAFIILEKKQLKVDFETILEYICKYHPKT